MAKTLKNKVIIALVTVIAVSVMMWMGACSPDLMVQDETVASLLEQDTSEAAAYAFLDEMCSFIMAGRYEEYTAHYPENEVVIPGTYFTAAEAQEELLAWDPMLDTQSYHIVDRCCQNLEGQTLYGVLLVASLAEGSESNNDIARWVWAFQADEGVFYTALGDAHHTYLPDRMESEGRR